MINKLIEEGKELKRSTYDSTGMGTMSECYDGPEFELWSSKVALFYQDQSESVVRDKVLKRYSSLNARKSIEFHEIAIGALKALQEMK